MLNLFSLLAAAEPSYHKPNIKSLVGKYAVHLDKSVPSKSPVFQCEPLTFERAASFKSCRQADGVLRLCDTTIKIPARSDADPDFVVFNTLTDCTYFIEGFSR